MFLHARGVLKRRLAAAAAQAKEGAQSIESAADQTGTAIGDAKRTAIAKARDELHAAFDRFHALMRDLEADAADSAGIIVGELGEPFNAAGRALDQARASLETDGAQARADEKADNEKARAAVDPASRL